MTESLPLSIHACDTLLQQFTNLVSVCNKLEAQFNFQTMIANWYGDESLSFQVQLSLETSQSFMLCKKNRASDVITNYSDDVFSYHGQTEYPQTIMCCIAMTDSELIMLTEQPTLIEKFLYVKLEKVLNLVAKQLKFATL